MPAISLDLGATIARHPWPAVAIALTVGAGIALAERSRSTLVRAASLAIGSALIASARELLAGKLAEHAHSWLDERDRKWAPRATR
jgi:hypothetical protein